MLHLTIFIALVILTSQGRVHHERINEKGEIVYAKGVPPELIRAMIIADLEIPQKELCYSEDLLKELDEITNFRIEPYLNYPDEDEICPLDRYRID